MDKLEISEDKRLKSSRNCWKKHPNKLIFHYLCRLYYDLRIN